VSRIRSSPLQSLIRTLGLSAAVRVLGFAPIDDFTGYMAACDIVLNLRYPTVGESSGSLLRALGLGKAVLVSGIGRIPRVPDDDVPQSARGRGRGRPHLRISEPAGLAPGRGPRAGRTRCAICERRMQLGPGGVPVRVVPENGGEGGEWDKKTEDRSQESEDRSQPPEVRSQKAEPVHPAYVAGWAANPESREYVDTHLTRLVRTLEITPPGGPEDRILEMGAYLQITPALRSKLGYGCVRGCYYGPAGKIDRPAHRIGGRRIVRLRDRSL
jgi:hypothetical protein